MKGYSAHSPGFTLIELLVVIGIIATLTAFLLPNLTSFGTKQNLSDSADNLQSLLRTAQNNATSGVSCPVAGETPVDWNVLIQGNSYTLTQDCKDADGTTQYHAIKTYDAATWGTVISGISLSNPGSCSPSFSAPGGVWIVFPGITGPVTFPHTDGSSCPSPNYASMTVTLQVSNNAGATKTVQIDKGGSISTQ